MMIKRILFNKTINSRLNYFSFTQSIGVSVKDKSTNSNWIYSSKYDEMLDSKKGKIYICTQTGNDCHDVTIRMYKAFFQSNIIFSYDDQQTQKLLSALLNKNRLIDTINEDNVEAPKPDQQEKDSSSSQFSTQIQSKNNITISKIAQELTSISLQKQQVKSFNRDIEMSKHLDMAIDIQRIAKKKNDPGNKILFQQQQRLREYLRMKEFRTQIEQERLKKGHPKVLPLLEQQSQIVYLHQNGFNATYVLHQYLIQKSSKLLNILEKLKLPYQILPSKSQLINTIVTSGLPADRFSIQYFPENITQILSRRKNMKMTIAMVIKKQKLYNTIQSVIQQYGKEHKIYVQNSHNKTCFSDQAHLFFEYQKQNAESFQALQNIKLVVSPYITEFNEVLKQQVNQIRHIYGQAVSQKTNFIQLQFLDQRLMKLKKKEATVKVDIFNMAAEMLEKLGDQQIVRKTLKSMLGLQKGQLQEVIKQGKKRIKIDYLGINEMLAKASTHKKHRDYSQKKQKQDK